ncbi:MAG: helix-turn-helix domain-containing protein [Burkholderiales bacterium]
MISKVDCFQDVHLHASSVREWRQTYSQISAGPLQSSLAQITTERCHVFREQINQRIVQQGEAPRGKVCFAVPLAVPGAARVQGREADDKCIFVLQGGDEFMFHMPTGTDILSITFDREEFDRALSCTLWPTGISALLRQPVVQVPVHRLVESRSRLLALFDAALARPELVATPEAERQLEQAMLGELLRLVADPGCDRNQRHGSSSRSFIVEKCHRLTVENAASAPSVVDLCQRLRVSRRTVQNSFQSVTATNPVNYIRSIRLNGARRELMTTTSADVSIGDAAAQWGFFHLSHFAAEYQQLFGELPSQTRRGAGAIGRPAASLAMAA